MPDLTPILLVFYVFQKNRKDLVEINFCHAVDCTEPQISFNLITVTWFSVISHCSNRESLTEATAHPEPDHTTPSVSPDSSSAASQPQSPVSSPPEQDASEILGPDYHLLSRRERTQAELLVETLARELVSHDTSLTSLLDTWAGKTTLDLMEDIFPSHGGHLRWVLNRWWK